MLGGLLSGLEWATQFSDALAWLVLGTFLATAALDWTGRREQARPLGVVGWALFGLFWFTLIYHFAVVQKSFIEGIGSVIAVPLAFYVGYLLWQGRDSLFVLSRAIVVMGLVFFPFESIPFLQRFLIEAVADQTNFLISLLGSDPALVTGQEIVRNGEQVVVHDGRVIAGKEQLYQNTFVFTEGNRVVFYSIIIACTGIGAMSIFAGLIMATSAPLRRKLRALAVSLPVIYVLNLLRNVMIAIGFGEQRFHFFPDLVLTLFGGDDPLKVSYYIIDRIVAQSLSVVALVGITYLVVRELPEILTIIEDLLYLVTGTEYDLEGTFETTPVRADGGR